GAARRDRVALDPDAPVLPDIRGMGNAMSHAVDQVIYDLNITPDIVNVDAALSGRRPFVVDGDDVIRDMGLVGVDKQYAVPPDRDDVAGDGHLPGDGVRCCVDDDAKGPLRQGAAVV